MWLREHPGQETNPSHRATDAASPPATAQGLKGCNNNYYHYYSYFFVLLSNSYHKQPELSLQCLKHFIFSHFPAHWKQGWQKNQKPAGSCALSWTLDVLNLQHIPQCSSFPWLPSAQNQKSRRGFVKEYQQQLGTEVKAQSETEIEICPLRFDCWLV